MFGERIETGTEKTKDHHDVDIFNIIQKVRDTAICAIAIHPLWETFVFTATVLVALL